MSEEVKVNQPAPDPAKPKEVQKLGDGEVFVTRDASGEIKMVQAVIMLQEILGDIYTSRGKTAITASGYSKLNKVANVSLLTPPTLVVDGINQNNPHIERHPTTKVIQSVALRRIGIGYSPIGNLVAVDKTLFLNIYTYFIQDIQAKMKKFPACAALGTKDAKPKSKTFTPRYWSDADHCYQEKPAQTVALESANMVFFSIEDPVGVWIDLDHPEIQEVFDQHTQRQKFGDRIAQSIVDRNILGEHPAIAQKQVTAQGEGKAHTALVQVFGHRHSLDHQRLQEISGELTSGQMRPRDIEVKAGVVEAEVEEVEVETQAEGDEHGKSPLAEEPAAPAPTEVAPPAAPVPIVTPPPPPKEAPKPATEKDDNKALVKQIVGGKAAIGAKAYDALLMKHFKTNTASGLSIADKKKLVALLNAEADKAAAKK